jgi:trk system potassium uptake protein
MTIKWIYLLIASCICHPEFVSGSSNLSSFYCIPSCDLFIKFGIHHLTKGLIMAAPKFLNLSPGRILVLSFLFVISAGAFLLSLPISRVVSIPLLDLLFTSASATCVTGLKIVPMSYFSFFGQCIILALIQIGGLGLMTLSIFLVSLVLNLSLMTKLVAGRLLDFEFSGKIKTFLKLIIGFTFGAEVIGASLLYLSFKNIFPESKAIFYSIFHSVSAFCNSGVTLFEPGVSKIATNTAPLLTMSALIFLGGIGFVVWYEIGKNTINSIKNWWNDEHKKITTTLHTKIVLFSSMILITLGSILFFILERTNSLKGFSLWHQIINSFFLSIATRTAGFDTISVAKMGLPILLIMIILMFIGGSPSSTAGGAKVTTFTLFLATIVAIVKNKESVELFGRSIPSDQIFKTTVIVALSLGWVGLTTFVLLLTEPKFTFIQILFESVATFSTAGFSTGITPYLSDISKGILIISMLLGRLGALTLVLALRKKEEKQLYKFPEERVLLG